MTLKVACVIQARMSSTRFPGKVLHPLPSSDDTTLRTLDWVVRRAARAQSVDRVIVATSSDPSDTPIVNYCNDQSYEVIRGSLFDVLGRVHHAARSVSADVVVRLTADCPLVDPGIIDVLVQQLIQNSFDFVANRLPPPATRTFPIGLDAEVATMDALSIANAEATRSSHREHVMPYIYGNPDRFRISITESPVDAGAVRWTIDTPQDAEAVLALIRGADANLDSPWQHLLSVWESNPGLGDLNRHVAQKAVDEIDSRTQDIRFQ